MNNKHYDKSSIASIFDYSRQLIGHTLRDFVPDADERKGKGGLGQLVEKLFFEYEINNFEGPDFYEAGVELKTTPLKLEANNELMIKERLVCCMINYCDDCDKEFEESHFYKKCLIMLILFYLHQSGSSLTDLKFLFALLWKLPEKDLIIMRNDYRIILDKIRTGRAHELSEGDTMFLAACRKGQKGDALRKQPYSDIGAPSRAWSLKPSYMRTLLEYIKKSGETALANFDYRQKGIGPSDEIATGGELVSIKELKKNSFDNILLKRIEPFYGKNVNEILHRFNRRPTAAKNKYAIAAGYIIGSGKSCDVNHSDEFLKAGLTMKTIRIEADGHIRESMSFENINYQEVYDCDNWTDSRLYELFSNRFMFVTFRATGHKIFVPDSNGGRKSEQEYELDKVFFWAMPQKNLELAEQYWEDIRKQVMADNIVDGAFWREADNNSFHVRPKGRRGADRDISPVTGERTADKFCYWFNKEYVRNIIESQEQ